MSLEDRVRRKVIAAKAENFRTLNLSGSPGSENQLETLPEELAEVANLEHLIAYSNRLETVPDCVTELSALKSLNLQSNTLTGLNEKLDKLDKLLFLGLAFNKLNHVPEEVFRLASLQILDVTANNLETISPDIAKLKNLHRLLLGPHPRGFMSSSDVALSNRITELPEEIGDLPHLRELSVGGNLLKSVPKSIGKLKELLRINFCNNQLSEVPDEIGELTSLTILRLWGNNLSKLPPLEQLKYLQDLNVRSNLLETIPDDIRFLAKLKSLDVSQNRLTSLSHHIGELSSLKELYLEGNNMSELPDVLANLKELRTLTIRKNNFTEIPAVVLKMTALEWLDVGRNQLGDLPEGISALTSLEDLIADSNRISVLPDSLGSMKSLKKLMLQNNRLTNVPDSIGKLKKLITLCLSYNKLSVIPHSFSELEPTIHLLIDGNPLVSPPAEIQKRGTAAILAYLRLVHTGGLDGLDAGSLSDGAATARVRKLMFGNMTPPSPSGGTAGKKPGLTRFKSEYDQDLRARLSATVVEKSPNVGWEEVAGLDDAKEALMEAVFLPLKQPQLFVGPRKPARGILLYGPPGNGKTHLAKAVATAAKVTFFSISAADLLSKWHGESEKLMQTLFSMARDAAPALVFIDEIDSLCSTRSSGDFDKDRRFKTEFLVQMDGFEPRDGVVILGATNRPADIDSAAMRRFTKKIYVPLPDEGARRRLFDITLSKGPVADLSEEDYKTLIEKTDGYSGSDIAVLCEDAVMAPVRDMLKATTFKTVSGKDPTDAEKQRDDLLTPCDPNEEGAQTIKLMEIESSRLLPPRKAEMKDFQEALKRSKATCSPDLIKAYEIYNEGPDKKEEKLWSLYT